jgi:hypothetical protein
VVDWLLTHCADLEGGVMDNIGDGDGDDDTVGGDEGQVSKPVAAETATAESLAGTLAEHTLTDVSAEKESII